jgi:hypothetical protein
MDEDDFVLSDGEDEPSNNRQESTSDAQEKLTSNRDTTKLSSKEQRKLLNKQHPELMPVVSHFSSIVKELEDTTRVATKALIHENGAAEVSTSSKLSIDRAFMIGLIIVHYVDNVTLAEKQCKINGAFFNPTISLEKFMTLIAWLAFLHFLT